MRNIEQKEYRMEHKWLLNDILPEGELVLLAGESGIGKSSLTAYLATLLPKDKNIYFWLLEDDVQSYTNKIGKRDNIHYIDYVDKDDIPYIPKVGEIVKDIKENNMDLLVIDPIAFMLPGGDNSMNDNAKVRALLTPLQNACKETGCCLIGVHHFSKGKGRVKDKATGAHAWVATPRHVLSFVKSPDEELFLEVTKSNIAKTGTSWEATTEIDKYCMRINNLVEADEGSAQEAINSTYDDDRKRAPKVILNLKEEFDIGEKFTLEDIKRLGNFKSFYNYIRKYPNSVQKHKDGKEVWYIFT